MVLEHFFGGRIQTCEHNDLGHVSSCYVIDLTDEFVPWSECQTILLHNPYFI